MFKLVQVQIWKDTKFGKTEDKILCNYTYKCNIMDGQITKRNWDEICKESVRNIFVLMFRGFDLNCAEAP